MSFWMTSKKDGVCSECGLDIKSGDRIVYDPDAHIVLCDDNMCGVAYNGPDAPRKEDRSKLLKECRRK